MLEIKNIKKEYRTAGLTQMALDGVSMNLRDNEFVAVLGPSGSGKTTLLNIIGGLDQADSGDLVINGVSTAKYKDRDWDTYRNHTIGFVFQSYNLIPHQTVLKNVELALVIGGVPESQRKERAVKALEDVGLKDHINKLPMQLSGGQMQRVAIARALVNDPDIVLADEPTGALDSKTGLQVMELLKKVAQDRLVVMVTHNPDLADQYATRIINLKDGVITHDSDPFDPYAGAEDEQSPDTEEMVLGGEQNPDAAMTAVPVSDQSAEANTSADVDSSDAADMTSDEVDIAVGEQIVTAPESAEAEAADTASDETDSESMKAAAAAKDEADSENAKAAAAATDEKDPEGTEAAAAVTDEADSESRAVPAKRTVEKRREKNKRASMSFFTALGLSFNNLMTKKGRTILVAFAGSIGIIGIALIMSLSNGVNKYIEDVERETLSQYPLQIQDTGFDLTSIVSTAEGIGAGGGSEDSDDGSGKSGTEDGSGKSGSEDGSGKSGSEDSGKSGSGDGGKGSGNVDGDPASTNGKGVDGSSVDEMDEYGKKIGEMRTVTEIFSKSNSNDLESFRKYLESDKCDIKQYTSAIEYRYSITPLIYREDDKNSFRQVNPDDSFSAVGLSGSSGTSNSLMSLMMSTDSFNALPADKSMYIDQYDVVAGHWPENEHELVLILSGTGDVSDLVLYILGERDPEELEEAVKKFAKGEEVTIDDTEHEYDSSFFMGQEFRLIKNSSCYKYDADKDIYIDKTDNKKYMNRVAKKGEILKIAGIVKPREDSNIASLTIGIGYHPDLVEYIIRQNEDSDIVQDQLADRGTNVLTGKEFGDDDNSDFDFQDMVTVDEDALNNAFKFDEGKLKVDPNKLPQPNKKDFDFSSVFKDMDTSKTQAAMAGMMSDLLTGFADYIKKELTDKEYLQKLAQDFVQYLQTDEARLILEGLTPESTSEEVKQIMEQLYKGFLKYAEEKGISIKLDLGKLMEEYMKSDEAQKIVAKYSAAMMPDMKGIAKKLQKQMTNGLKNYMVSYTKVLMSQLVNGLKHAMTINPDAFVTAFRMDMDEDDLTQMITQLMTTGNTSYEDNMKAFGYADMDKPSMIMIYPKDFESKDHVTEIIDNYNDDMKKSGEDDKVITYSDIVGALMTSVTDIINQLSMILIAFVGISLVVSSIMIGVITYISVLERKKEIGILRAMGASKGNVANVFNAETFIIGALAGLMGIGLAFALIPVENHIIQTLSGGTPMHAQISLESSALLVLLSIVLTLIGGWIPSRKAAKSDPVTALRTE